ncbi:MULTISPECIES: SprT family zinc-dependent metalloprotease [unclassified Moritella]|uniref:SprT family zinc-dependent metalloprotease n=1 Tax=unclassified Moritella TaxID=2637987 RepID=UPI001BA5EADB|nr:MULTISPECIES: SprT family zinc-dependent metalloprotease [unclassified Moritella]QUM83745.1 SprT family zinc-dependent metalloprotease [Moritella sp. 28]QUM88037.1 SprT family zinc-dependent metalloprotease [Moritella sp. 36]
MLNDLLLQQNVSSHTVEQLVLDKIETCYQQAELKLNKTFPRPSINFKQRGKAAGSARLQINELRFNSILLQENQQHFIAHTVPHEVAHLLVYQIYGRTKPHGKEWQQIMNQIFDLAAKTTHQYDVSTVKGKTFTYACHCTEHLLTIRRHNKIVRDSVKYICRSCKQSLIIKHLITMD